MNRTPTHISELKHAVRMDVGMRRQNNEDNHLCLPAHGVFVVADGMGGLDGGEVASQAVIDGIREAFDGSKGPWSLEQKRDRIGIAMNATSRWIRKRCEERGKGQMGSTMIVLVFDPANPARAEALHAGDSRLYRYRGQQLEQLTTDHSLLTDIGHRVSKISKKTFKHVITRAVGLTDQVELTRTPVDILPGDLFLLCTDGLYDMLDQAEMTRILAAGQDLERACRMLVNQANKAGGTDNITVLLVRSPKPETQAFDESEQDCTAEFDMKMFGEANDIEKF